MGYNNCLIVRVSEAGLGMSVFFPFRFKHPSLFIPWSAVFECREGRFFLLRGVSVDVPAAGARIVFRGRVADAVLKQWTKRAETASTSRAAHPQ